MVAFLFVTTAPMSTQTIPVDGGANHNLLTVNSGCLLLDLRPKCAGPMRAKLSIHRTDP